MRFSKAKSILEASGAVKSLKCTDSWRKGECMANAFSRIGAVRLRYNQSEKNGAKDADNCDVTIKHSKSVS